MKRVTIFGCTGDDIPKSEREALTKLGEEAGELVQAICKTLNFGFISSCENRTWLNLQKTQAEAADVLAVIDLCVQAGLFGRERLSELACAKLGRLQERLNHAVVSSTNVALIGAPTSERPKFDYEAEYHVLLNNFLVVQRMLGLKNMQGAVDTVAVINRVRNLVVVNKS